MKKQYSFFQTKNSTLRAMPRRVEAVSYQMVIFLGGGVFHSQPQPTFQCLQIAEQNVVDFITYQRRMGFIRCAAAVQAVCQFPQLVDERSLVLPFLGFHWLFGAHRPKFSSWITDKMVSSSSQSAENAVGA